LLFTCHSQQVQFRVYILLRPTSGTDPYHGLKVLFTKSAFDIPYARSLRFTGIFIRHVVLVFAAEDPNEAIGQVFLDGIMHAHVCKLYR